MPAFVLIDSIPWSSPASRPCRVRGFTLIEMIFTVVILAILLSLAAPSFSDLVRDQRVKTAIGDVHATLIYARSEAIKRNANVNIIIASGTDWAAGWSVQLPTTSPDCPTLPCILKTQDALSGINITGTVSPVTFRGDGRLTAAASVSFDVRSSESASTTARCVRLDLSGRPNIKVDTDKNSANGCQ